MVSFLDLPTELRQKILALAIWTPTQAPSTPTESQDRVRLRDEWDIWVPVAAPKPAVLPFILTSKALRDDVSARYLQQQATYELDVMFLPGCGLWPTWTCCPGPGQLKLASLRVVFRIFDPNSQVPGDYSTRANAFTRRFPAISSTFDAANQFPNPPPAAWNFYRLLISLLSLGPRGLVSRAAHRARRGSLLSSPPLCTVDRLALVLETQPRTRSFTMRLLQEQAQMHALEQQTWHRPVLQLGQTQLQQHRHQTDMQMQRALLQAQQQAQQVQRLQVMHQQQTMQQRVLRRDPDVPYSGGSYNSSIFPGPPPGSGYEWSGPTTISTAQSTHYDDADRLGLWLANAMWALLKFGRLSRGFGLIVFEGIVEFIEFSVDGENRQPRYDMRELLARLPNMPMRGEDMEVLLKWRQWLYGWRGEKNGEHPEPVPRPTLAFPRYPPGPGPGRMYSPVSAYDDF